MYLASTLSLASEMIMYYILYVMKTLNFNARASVIALSFSVSICSFAQMGCEEDAPSSEMEQQIRDMGPGRGGDTSGETGGGTGGETSGVSLSGEDDPAGDLIGGETFAGDELAGFGAGGQVITGDDRDLDGVIDAEDNCPDTHNPQQSDLDLDGEGDACEPDMDSDGIPNTWDPEPQDPTWPGRALPDTVYAHTDQSLYALSVKVFRLDLVAPFTFDVEGNHRVTDIAFDRAGVLWAITFNTLWLCHPQTGECRSQGRLPFTNFNGLTFLPGELFESDRDVLVGIDIAGAWRRLELADGVITDELIGMYPNETSSGDAFSIEGVGTFASVKRSGVNSDLIVRVNPTSPREVEDFVVLEGYQKIYGLAGWRGALFAFDETGAIIRVDLNTREVMVLNTQPAPWWGAGVSPILHSLSVDTGSTP